MTELIADLPWDDRPRERMMAHGPSTLSNAELIAIMLGSGTRGLNAIQLARELLRDGGWEGLKNADAAKLARQHGVGPAKATRVVAAFEFARRFLNRVVDEPLPYDATVLGRSLITAYSKELQEHAGAVFLDSRHCIIRQKEIFVGTSNHALVSPKDIIRCAVVDHTCAIVLYHNHPSGSPAPSAEDIVFTERMEASLKLIDIELVDHLIIGGNSYVSMRQGGLLSPS